MKKIILIVFAAALTFSSCEKDDICDANTPTTPRLVINFYDAVNPSVKRNVPNLRVIGDGMTNPLLIDGLETATVNTISLPLKTIGTTTTFRLTLNSGNANPALVNEDIIKFDYATGEIFVSRACGYKTVYTLDRFNPVTHTDPIATDRKWIKLIAVVKNNIDNENEEHIQIYF